MRREMSLKLLIFKCIVKVLGDQGFFPLGGLPTIDLLDPPWERGLYSLE